MNVINSRYLPKLPDRSLRLGAGFCPGLGAGFLVATAGPGLGAAAGLAATLGAAAGPRTAPCPAATGPGAGTGAAAPRSGSGPNARAEMKCLYFYLCDNLSRTGKL